MCGICGYTGPRREGLLGAMTASLAHRGPDGEGYFSIPGKVHLGHRRLAIIDVESGQQPLFSEDGQVALILNGEIYNHLDLRRELEGRGHIFSSRTDGEVIVHAFEEFGPDCVHRLNGMFAFALWDGRQETLWLFRDRVGIKHLMYAEVGPHLIFGSETRAILVWPEIDRTLDADSLTDYLKYRYVPEPNTLLRSIHRLPPGHRMSVHQGLVRIEKYWSPSPDQQVQNLSFHEAAERFGELLKDSVRLRLMSDVPFGSFLSAGIDSGTVVGLMSQHLSKPVECFSVGFGDAQDEVEGAREVAECFGAEHHAVRVSPKDLERLPEAVAALDSPVGDAIILPMFLLAEFAASKVKMVLTGEGADELFGGYGHQHMLHLLDRLSRGAMGVALGAAGSIVEWIPVSILDKFFRYPASLGREGRRRLKDLLSVRTSRPASYDYFASLFLPRDLEAMVLPELATEGRRKSEIYRLLGEENGDYFRTLILNEWAPWLPSNILFKLDRLTMAHSLEGRVPFLDHRLIQFAYGLSDNVLSPRRGEKALLRDVAAELLGPEQSGRKKQAFYIPLEAGYYGALRELMGDCLSDEVVRRRGIFRPNAIARIVAEFGNGELTSDKKAVSLLILELWCRVVLDGKTVPNQWESELHV